MRTLIYCRTMDEVNTALAEQWCDEMGLAFHRADPRDALFPADADGLVIDLDHLALCPREREHLLGSLAMRLLPYPVAIAAYDLDVGAAEPAECRGVLTAPRMDQDLIRRLAEAIERARSEVAA